MALQTKLIVGLHTTGQAITLEVTSELAPSDPAPALTATGRTSEKTYTQQYDSVTGWTIDLDADDYVIELAVDETQWLDGTMNVRTTDDSDTVFVVFGEYQSAKQTVAWSAPSTATSGDPKDPWPPPGTAVVQLPTASKLWFDDQLSRELTTPRDAGELAFG